ncbi:Fc receptor-like protein 5 isoform X2 [Ascaphus truei]|uniref:Fc receptor-like protein 5 isoform X2 n=1 Tax=Ascaphus truei TaxID=8439 RepID=UPI003F59E90B
MHWILRGCFYLSLYLLRELNSYEAALVPPSITFSAGYATYLTGESASLLCQVTAPFRVGGYRFFQDGLEVHSKEDPSGKKYKIVSMNRGSAGSYTCQYWVSDARGQQKSALSPAVSLYVLDQPSTPSLLKNPQHTLYLEGESVTLMCDHPPTLYLGGYRFYKDRLELGGHRDALGSQYVFPILQTGNTGTYYCGYWLSGNGRELNSARSSPTALDVTALSSSPSLTFLPPYSVFILGESLNLECAAPSPLDATLYRLYKEGQELSSTLTGTHTLHNVTWESQGEYSCMYWSQKSQREIPSIQSVTRELYVTDPLGTPYLYLDPPSGQILDGGNVTLLCTTPVPYERTTFFFLCERKEIHSISTNRTQRSMAVTVTVWRSNTTSATKYSCQYTAEIRGRVLFSPESSQAEIIVITGSLHWLIAVIVSAGLVVLICIILLLYWVLLARKDSEEVCPKSSSSSECTSALPQRQTA